MVKIDLADDFEAVVSVVSGYGFLLKPRHATLRQDVWNASDELEGLAGFAVHEPTGDDPWSVAGWHHDGREALVLYNVGPYVAELDDEDSDDARWHELAREADVLLDPALWV